MAKKKLINHQVLMSSQLQNRSFHVFEKTRAAKSEKNDEHPCKA